MKVIKQGYKILKIDELATEFIERCARTCYKSEGKITSDSANKLVKQLIKSGHHSVLEHCHISVRFITDRAVTHELVRHRIASFSQESQRFVKYKTGIEFILPVWLSDGYIRSFNTADEIYKFCDSMPAQKAFIAQPWLISLFQAEGAYIFLRSVDLKPEQARTVLPESTKTEIVITANIREWRHIFKLRCSKKAYPQMRDLMTPLMIELYKKMPILFGDLVYPKIK